MNTKKLLLMAENICVNFSAYPQESRTQSIDRHMEMFWTPKMKEQLSQHFQKTPEEFSEELRKVFSHS